MIKKTLRFARRPDPISKTGVKMKNLNQQEKTIDLTANNTKSGVCYANSFDKSQYNVNPDILVQKKGLGVYDYMLADDQISSLAMLKKITRLATSFEVYSVDDDPKNTKIADFVRWNLSNMQISLREFLFNILTAMDYGFSISEKVLTYLDHGPFKGHVVYKTIAPKSPHGFLFDRDQNGDIKPDGIVQDDTGLAYTNWDELSRRIVNGKNRFSVNDFVLFSYNSRFRNPYGNSDFKSAYRGWISKDVLMKYWNMYLERYGAPIPYAEIPVGTDQDNIDNIKKIVSTLQNRSAFTVPQDTKVNYLESTRTATPGFEKAIAIYNGAMSRSSLVPDLMGFSGGTGTGGSYGLGKTQYDVFIMLLEFIGLLIEENVFDKQIIKPIVDLNFPNVTDYPKFKFGTIKRETRKDRAQMLQVLAATGIITEVQEWMYGFCDLPTPHSQIPVGATLIPTQAQHDLDNAGLQNSEDDEQTIADDTQTSEDLGRGEDRL